MRKSCVSSVVSGTDEGLLVLEQLRHDSRTAGFYMPGGWTVDADIKVDSWASSAANSTASFGTLIPPSPTNRPDFVNGRAKFHSTSYLQSTSPTLTAPTTFIIFAHPDGNVVSQALVDSSNTSSRQLIYAPSSGLLQVFAGSAVVCGTPKINGKITVIVRVQGSTSRICCSGLDDVTGNAGVGSLVGMHLGASATGGSNFKGFIDGCIILDYAASNEEIETFKTIPYPS